MFNVLQIIELMALVDLRYPAKLNQFLHGFKFSMLNPPEKFNFASKTTGEGDTQTTKDEDSGLMRLREFGFKSRMFLVMQYGFLTLASLVLIVKILISLKKRNQATQVTVDAPA